MRVLFRASFKGTQMTIAQTEYMTKAFREDPEAYGRIEKEVKGEVVREINPFL